MAIKDSAKEKAGEGGLRLYLVFYLYIGNKCSYIDKYYLVHFQNETSSQKLILIFDHKLDAKFRWQGTGRVFKIKK
jgi:hypothetical protein